MKINYDKFLSEEKRLIVLDFAKIKLRNHNEEANESGLGAESIQFKVFKAILDKCEGNSNQSSKLYRKIR